MYIIKSIYKYAFKLFSKWYTLVSLFLFVSSLIARFSVTNNKVNDFIQSISDYSLYVFIVCFFIASYQVWLEVQQELDKIKKNPVKYRVTAKLKKLFIDLDKIKKHYITEEDINELIKKCENEISIIENPIISNNPIWMENLGGTLSSILKKPDDEYISELKNYKKELEAYIKNSHENFLQWNKFSCDLKNIYIVNLEIKNIGIKSDENVSVEINLNSNSYINNLESFENYTDFLNSPNKPSREKSFINNPNSYYPSLSGGRLNNHSISYIMLGNYEPKKISRTFKDMNVGSNMEFHKNDILIDLPNKEDIKIVIRSKNSNSEMEEKLEFTNEYDNRIEYFDYLMSQE